MKTRQDRKKVLVVGAGSGFDIQVIRLLNHCPGELEPVIVSYGRDHPELRRVLGNKPIRSCTLRFFRQQARERPVWRSLPDLLLGTLSALEIVFRERPVAIVGIGQRSAVCFLIAGRLFGSHNVFVECITRVTKPSITGRIVARFRLADELYVQWPQATSLLRGSAYEGRLV